MLLNDIRDRISRGLATERKHPEYDLFIYNYADKCQYDKQWDECTLLLRGLVLDKEGNIVARAFDKFFNIEETGKTLEELVNEHGSYYIEEKLDGSLILVFWYKDEWHTATRGSFDSEQALLAKTLLGGFDGAKDCTHLFELIHPSNRIVVDYGDRKELVYLASRDFHTGKYYHDLYCTTNFSERGEYSEMLPNIDGQEGYVLVFKDGYRVKIKFEEYKRLHKLISGLSSSVLLEELKKEEIAIENLLVSIPEEFLPWANEEVRKFRCMFIQILQECVKEYSNIFKQIESKEDGLHSKKDFALKAKDHRYSAVLFSLYNAKDVDSVVWKYVEQEWKSLNRNLTK